MPSKRDRKCRLCPTLIARENKTGLCDQCYRAEKAAAVPSERIRFDRESKALKAESESLKKKYDEALRVISRQEAALGVLDELRAGAASRLEISPREGSGTSEATPILVASDWHAEEIVKPSQVSGLNAFDPAVCDRRAETFFRAGLRLVRLLAQDVKINTVVLALLGDFITNDIHGQENAESAAALPVEALLKAQNLIISGIEFLLDNSKYEFTVPCKVGNHSRTTKRVHSATEAGHSLETLLYVGLAAYFRKEPRVRFAVEDGYHTYLDVYGKTIRFHHGHAIQFQGGIGGLFIPAYKAVAQWNKARRADLDVFGHFHQTKDGGNFLCNGSLIGYNAFALRIKADWEPPMQSLVLVDKKRGRTCTWPILLETKG